MKVKQVVQSVIVVVAVLSWNAAFGNDMNYPGILKVVTQEIARLKDEFPQLKNFSASKNMNSDNLTISYEYHTHQPKRRGGWTSGVPNPDDDGIWFYIDFHDADSTAQIHTQPVTPLICLGDKRVSFLILEGAGTKSVSAALWKILEENGAKQCGQKP